MKNTVKSRRKELKLSQEMLAIKSKVSRATISLIENEKGVILKTSTMERIAEALQTTVKELFFS